MKKWIILTIVCAALAAAAVAWAGPGEGPRGDGDHLEKVLGNPKAAAELGVTDEQISKVRDVIYEHRKAGIDLHAKKQLAELELKKLMAQESPDETAVLAAVDEVGRIGTELRKNRIKGRLAVRAIVGPDVMAAVKERFGERRGEFREHGFGPRGGQGPGEGPGPRRGFRNDGQSFQDEEADPMDFGEDAFVLSE